MPLPRQTTTLVLADEVHACLLELPQLRHGYFAESGDWGRSDGVLLDEDWLLGAPFHKMMIELHVG